MKQHILYTIFVAFVFTTACQSDIQETESSESFNLNQEDIFIQQNVFESNDLGFISPEKYNRETKIFCTGMIDVPPENRAVVSAMMGGFIRKTPFLIGDHVKKGQELIVIENPEFVSLQQQFLEASAKESYLLSEYERQKTLNKENINSLKQLKQVESEYMQAKAQKSGLTEKLRMLNIDLVRVLKGEVISRVAIYAPISGVISKVNVNQGTYVDAAKPILEIIDTDHLHLELKVFEKDLVKLEIGQKIRFKLPETSGETYNGNVFLIGNTIDEINRTANIHGHLEDVEAHFAVGMFIEAIIILKEDEQWGVKNSAVIKTNEENFLLKLVELKDSVYHFKKVDLSEFSEESEFLHFDGIEQDTSAKFLIGAYHLVGVEAEE
tara:strand:- start:26957 stop:28099 length:1143 start_codon:yes stop_codon:yes gene_type:complete